MNLCSCKNKSTEDVLFREIKRDVYEHWIKTEIIDVSFIERLIGDNEDYLVQLNLDIIECDSITNQVYRDECKKDIQHEILFFQNENKEYEEKLRLVE